MIDYDYFEMAAPIGSHRMSTASGRPPRTEYENYYGTIVDGGGMLFDGDRPMLPVYSHDSGPHRHIDIVLRCNAMSMYVPS